MLNGTTGLINNPLKVLLLLLLVKLAGTKLKLGQCNPSASTKQWGTFSHRAQPSIRTLYGPNSNSWKRQSAMKWKHIWETRCKTESRDPLRRFQQDQSMSYRTVFKIFTLAFKLTVWSHNTRNNAGVWKRKSLPACLFSFFLFILSFSFFDLLCTD